MAEQLQAFMATLPPGPFVVEWENCTGLNDDGYWEWWEVAGIKFREVRQAEAFCAMLNAAMAPPHG